MNKNNQLPAVSDLTIDERGMAHHPSFGTIRISRVTGSGQTFFNSDMFHDEAMEITVHRASMDVKDGYVHDEEIVAIFRMSELQYAHAITSPNGPGTPVTLAYVQEGKLEKMPRPPAPIMRVDKFRKEMRESANTVYEKAKNIQEEVLNISDEGKNMSKSQMKKLVNDLTFLIQHIDKNLPFVVQKMEEATNEMVAEAKIEINAIGRRMMAQTGRENMPIELGGEEPQNALEG